MKARIASNLACALRDADPDQRDYLVEVEYCKAVAATEMNSSASSLEEYYKARIAHLEEQIAILEAIV